MNENGISFLSQLILPWWCFAIIIMVFLIECGFRLNFIFHKIRSRGFLGGIEVQNALQDSLWATLLGDQIIRVMLWLVLILNYSVLPWYWLVFLPVFFWFVPKLIEKVFFIVVFIFLLCRKKI